MNIAQFQTTFLKQSMDGVKKRLGGECSFLSFESYKDLLFFKAKMGGDTIRIQINAKMENIGNNEFEDLYKILSTKSYVSKEAL